MQWPTTSTAVAGPIPTKAGPPKATAWERGTASIRDFMGSWR
jgi:hypothetical protein